MLLHGSPFVAILLLQSYGNYPPTTCLHTISASHLRMPNDAMNIWIVIYLVRQESNDYKTTVWTERHSFTAHQGLPGSFLNTNQSTVPPRCNVPLAADPRVRDARVE